MLVYAFIKMYPPSSFLICLYGTNKSLFFALLTFQLVEYAYLILISIISLHL
jgi:hypothetical protein